ncbi:hypothetical protein [Nocardioides panaciterrulae]|uniref:Uncharacterized protein n=1 Tax=Nocardioides panaciterrulae TaxID=661492 RepID=A0A7Y9JAT9_9ACTN|nr:hypothetical protein [Nocardioides panaciterrulae]NYD41708.1 hypothetical protein [Nocardioides panaciterrulae]
MRKTLPAVALSTAALTIGLAGPASAELYGIDDPRDTGHGSDILAVQVRYAKPTLHVTTYHENLRRDPATGSSETIFIDTDRSNRGPEYVFSAGLYEGTDYVLRETEGFARDTWGDPVENGDYILRIRYRADQARVRISSAALGTPDAVRLAVRASGTRTDGTSHGLVDWLGQRRSFTPWIARG